jgi:hypothetical protein
MSKILKFIILGIALIFAIGMVKMLVFKAVSLVISFLVIGVLGYVGYRMFIK